MSRPIGHPEFIDNGNGRCWHCGQTEDEHSVGPFPVLPPFNSSEAVREAAETIRAYKDRPATITREEHDAMVSSRDFYADLSLTLADALEFLLEHATDWNRNTLAPFDEFPVVQQARAALAKAGRS